MIDREYVELQMNLFNNNGLLVFFCIYQRGSYWDILIIFNKPLD